MKLKIGSKAKVIGNSSINDISEIHHYFAIGTEVTILRETIQHDGNCYTCMNDTMEQVIDGSHLKLINKSNKDES